MCNCECHFQISYKSGCCLCTTVIGPGSTKQCASLSPLPVLFPLKKDTPKEIEMSLTESSGEESSGGSTVSVQAESLLGKYSVIYADPPWVYRDKLDKTRTLSNHYKTMSLQEIYVLEPWNIPVQDLAAKNSFLLLWSTSPQLPEALTVMKKWGFTYKTQMVWCKPRMGMGSYFRSAHETLLLGTRGKPKVKFKSQWSWMTAPVQAHSQKPQEMYKIIERMFDGPYLELFARHVEDGWDAWGDQAETSMKDLEVALNV